MLLYKYGNAMRYSVRTGCRIITLLMSLNSFQSSSLHRREKNEQVKKKIISETHLQLIKRAMSLPNIVIFDEWFEFRTARNCHVQCFGSEKTLRIEQIEKVFVDQIGEQLIRQTVKCGHLRQ